MIQHTITPLPNGNFLLKLLSSEPGRQTIQTMKYWKLSAVPKAVHKTPPSCP